MLNIPDEIKILLKQSSVQKNFRVHFPNGECRDLINTDVIEESVEFTESLCSRDTFKFGLCEASHISFEIVNAPNIKGLTIECGLDIDISSLDEYPSGWIQRADLEYPTYYIPYGLFVVESCQKQADMSHRAVEAYSRENFLNVAIPNSIRELKGYTWLTDETIGFTAEDLLDLTFPSYSYNRNSANMEDSRTPHISCINNNGWYVSVFNADATCEMRIHYTQLRFNETESNSNYLVTYKIHFDKDLYDETLSEFKSKYNFIADPKSNVDTLLGRHPVGEPFLCSFGTAYADVSSNRITLQDTSIIGTPVGYAFNTDITLESDVPYTHFKPFRYSYVSTSKRYINGVIIEPKPSNPSKYHYMNDDGGSVFVPRSIAVYYRGTGVLREEQEVGYLEFHRRTIGQTGIPLLTLSSVPSFRNLWNFDMNKETVADAVRDSDPSFRNNVITKIEANDWRTIIESALELSGAIGRYGRDGNFEVVKLSVDAGLYPSETLYPNYGLYPRLITGELLSASSYKSAWYDDNRTLPIRKIQTTLRRGEETIDYTYNIPKNQYIFEPIIQQLDIGTKDKLALLSTEDDSGKYLGVPELEKNSVFTCNIAFSELQVYGGTNVIVIPMDRPTTYFDLEQFADYESVLAIKDNITYIWFNKLDIESDITSGGVDVAINNSKPYDTYATENIGTYIMEDNYFLQNVQFTEQQIETIFTEVGKNICDFSYTPATIESIGQPYIEAGDWITVVGIKDAFDTIVLERTITGIQALSDSYESKGE